jgi:hypothetical protein
MIPFSQEMFPDEVVYFRHVPATSGQGGSRRTFPTEGVTMRASVQKYVDKRSEAEGRSYTEVDHTVRTTDNPHAVAGDMFHYTPRGESEPHVLAVQGHSEPGGIGDVIWITPCLETR